MVVKVAHSMLYGGVYTICGMVGEVIHSVREFVPTVRWRFMGELWRS